MKLRVWLPTVFALLLTTAPLTAADVATQPGGPALFALELGVADLGRAVEFYTTLGFEVVAEQPAGTWTLLGNGEARLALALSTAPVAAEDSARAYPNFTVSDVEAAGKALVAAYLESRGEGPFRALYRRHTPRIYQLALRILGGDERDAEEAVQETWIRAVRKLDAFAWRSTLSTWITGIAINVCRDLVRRRRSRPRPVAEEAAAEPAGPEPVGTVLTKDLRLDLERAISSLPQRSRQVLVLHDVEGYTHVEIGRFLDIEAGTSKSQLFQARKAMRARLGAER
ncbi:MAG: sigma-70 family RNA polymerase sigma factor [bacterium]|nr:sigma-70 family RNA polymerase sigma factor [bacterium]